MRPSHDWARVVPANASCAVRSRALATDGGGRHGRPGQCGVQGEGSHGGAARGATCVGLSEWASRSSCTAGNRGPSTRSFINSSPHVQSTVVRHLAAIDHPAWCTFQSPRYRHRSPMDGRTFARVSAASGVRLDAAGCIDPPAVAPIGMAPTAARSPTLGCGSCRGTAAACAVHAADLARDAADRRTDRRAPAMAGGVAGAPHQAHASGRCQATATRTGAGILAPRAASPRAAGQECDDLAATDSRAGRHAVAV